MGADHEVPRLARPRFIAPRATVRRKRSRPEGPAR